MTRYELRSQSEATPLGKVVDEKSVYFIKQSIGNACGTIGLIHALANNTGRIPMDGELIVAVFCTMLSLVHNVLI